MNVDENQSFKAGTAISERQQTCRDKLEGLERGALKRTRKKQDEESQEGKVLS